MRSSIISSWFVHIIVIIIILVASAVGILTIASVFFSTAYNKTLASNIDPVTREDIERYLVLHTNKREINGEDSVYAADYYDSLGSREKRTYTWTEYSVARFDTVEVVYDDEDRVVEVFAPTELKERMELLLQTSIR